jgi:hypothetical protein
VQITREVELLTTVKTLRKLTGVNQNSTPEAWMNWWRENSGAWDSRAWAAKRPTLRGESAPHSSR